MTAFNPDGPHSPDLTRQAAGELAELARYLNYCSMAGSGGLEYPADAYDLLGSLVMLAGRLPQLLGQLDKFLAAQATPGRLRADDGGNVTGLISGAGSHLHEAAQDARCLAAELREAQNAVSGLSVKESTDGE